MVITESIIGGIVSKIINDSVDVSKMYFEQEIINKENNVQIQLYQAIINALNNITHNKYIENQEIIYETAENIMKTWGQSGYANYGKKVKINITDTDSVEYRRFIEKLCDEISLNNGIYKQIILMANNLQISEIYSMKNNVEELKRIVNENCHGKKYEKRDISFVINHITACLNNYLYTNENAFWGEDMTWYEDVAASLNTIFDISWKDTLLTYLYKVKNSDNRFYDSIEYIRSNELCESVLQCAKGLFENYEWEKDDRIHLSEIIKEQKFNKILVITGNEGAGKTYFIRKYIKNTLKDIKNEKKIIIPVIVSVNELETSANVFLDACGEALCVNLDNIEICAEILKEYRFKICFILDDFQILAIKNYAIFSKIINQIKQFSRYEEFRWILALDEHDYYLLGGEYKFIRNYAIKKESFMNEQVRPHILFDDAFSLTSYNSDNKVNSTILQNYYNVKLAKTEGKFCNIDQLDCFDTPLMTHIFGQCVENETVLNLPNTYIEYIEKMLKWKTDSLAKNNQFEFLQNDLRKILQIIYELKDITISKGKLLNNVNENCIRELLINQLAFYEKTKETDFFKSEIFKCSYILQNKVFWAAKMIGYLNEKNKLYAVELKKFTPKFVKWLVPCYILLIYKNKQEYFKLFNDLFENELGAYALFSAQKMEAEYSRKMFEYLKENVLLISDAKTCYAAMCFTFFSKLKMREKFILCLLIEKKVFEYQLEDIYNDFFTAIVDKAGKSKNLKNNAFILSSGTVERINIINGYVCGKKYCNLLYEEKKDFMVALKELIYTIYRKDEIKEQLYLKNRKKKSFMDCFIRACFEYQISRKPNLISEYDKFIPLFEEDAIVGPFLRKNFTCAAGNYFSRYGKNTSYRKKYIELVKSLYIRREKRYKETALFLIINSRQNELNVDEELYEILKKIMKDPWMQGHFGKKEDVKFWLRNGKKL